MSIALTATAFALSGLALPAQAAPAQDYCVAVVSKTGQVAKTCDVRQGTPKLLAARAAASSKLMTWYDNWKFDASAGAVEWWGSFGTCDKDGYTINMDANNFPSWKNRISSFRVHEACWVTMAYYDAYSPSGPSARYTGSVEWVGNDYRENDNFEGFHVST
ncbi:hypothetical protein [Lentzea sp. HUAS12]|uniref:hypothetical protein n=1 Tax=Lentzea sp. HUAS12 TaxID=2951806 RepID=UPI00209F2709|nr:hypothetical protein [Lentzea sp. HUAS12]USX50165.1 hypothetical protein ND450_32950 [Lentzea sp. HUAS12]